MECSQDNRYAHFRRPPDRFVLPFLAVSLNSEVIHSYIQAFVMVWLVTSTEQGPLHWRCSRFGCRMKDDEQTEDLKLSGKHSVLEEVTLTCVQVESQTKSLGLSAAWYFTNPSCLGLLYAWELKTGFLHGWPQINFLLLNSVLCGGTELVFFFLWCVAKCETLWRQRRSSYLSHGKWNSSGMCIQMLWLQTREMYMQWCMVGLEKCRLCCGAWNGCMHARQVFSAFCSGRRNKNHISFSFRIPWSHDLAPVSEKTCKYKKKHTKMFSGHRSKTGRAVYHCWWEFFWVILTHLFSHWDDSESEKMPAWHKWPCLLAVAWQLTSVQFVYTSRSSSFCSQLHQQSRI